MFKKILIGVAVLLLGLIGFIAAQPSTFRVERSATIAAPAEVVFAQINEFRNWEGWSPWEGLDPNQKRTYEGAPAGVGAVYGWSGNDQAGEGRMEITESRENERVVIKLEFTRPFPATNTVDFTLASEADGTKVTWGMNGENGFMSKAFFLFVDMNALLGADFEKGLDALKQVSESKAKALAEEQAKAEAEAVAEAATEGAEDDAAPTEAEESGEE